jgi:hypothetical protein
MLNWSAKKQEIEGLIKRMLPPAGRKPSIEYYSPNGFLPHSYLHCLEELCFFNDHINEIWRKYVHRCLGMKELGINPYYVSDKMLGALLNTDLPDISTPIRGSAPFLKLFLPTGALLDDDGDSIVILILEDFQLWHECVLKNRKTWSYNGIKKRNYLLEMMESIDDPSEMPRFTVHAFTEHGSLYAVPINDGDKVLEPAEGMLVINNGAVEDVLDALKRISINVLYLLESYPEYISSPSIKSSAFTKGRGFGSASKKNHLRSPRCIGVDFNVRIDQNTSGAALFNARVIAKRMHLRRGHWRRQRTGSGLRHQKYTWIKPMLINAT